MRLIDIDIDLFLNNDNRTGREAVVRNRQATDDGGGYTDLEVLEVIDPGRAARIRIRQTRWVRRTNGALYPGRPHVLKGGLPMIVCFVEATCFHSLCHHPGPYLVEVIPAVPRQSR